MAPTQHRIKELLSYDGNSGMFVWIKKTAPNSRGHIGSVAGSIHKHGYRVIAIDGRQHQASRLAWIYTHGEINGQFIDHINGDRSDNRLSNLRIASQSQNNQNIRSARSKTGTGFLGVTQSRGKFAAQLLVNGHNKHIGYFKTPDEAHAAYLTAKREHHEFCTI